MNSFLVVLSFLALIAVSSGQHQLSFGGSVPQAGLASPNIDHKADNVICLNVEITRDILIREIDYYAADARQGAYIVANFLRVKDCVYNCAASISKLDSISLGSMDSVSEEFYQLKFNKTGYTKDVLTKHKIQFIPKGSILGLLIGKNEASLIGVDTTASNPYTDRFVSVDGAAELFTFSDIKAGQKWRYSIRVLGNPVLIDSTAESFVGWNIGSGWNSALIPSFTPYSGSYIVSTFMVHESYLITGFFIHASTAGPIRIKFISFDECEKPNVDCYKYLEILTSTSQTVPHDKYHIRSSSLRLELYEEGLVRYDLVTPFYTGGNTFILLDQSEGGRVSIDTAREGDSYSDFAFEASKLTKLSGKNDANWKFTIRAVAKPFEFVPELATTTTPNKASSYSSSLIFLALFVLMTQIGI